MKQNVKKNLTFETNNKISLNVMETWYFLKFLPESFFKVFQDSLYEWWDLSEWLCLLFENYTEKLKLEKYPSWEITHNFILPVITKSDFNVIGVINFSDFWG